MAKITNLRLTYAEIKAQNPDWTEAMVDDYFSRGDDSSSLVDDVTGNTADIERLRTDVAELEHRVFGDTPPNGFSETQAYFIGDYVVEPVSGTNNYFQAIADNGPGAFNPLDWQEVSLEAIEVQIDGLEAADVVLDGLIKERVEWKNVWIPGDYLKNDMVRDGRWTMIANTDTSDRAGPQPTGDPYDIYEGTISTTSTLSKVVIFGNRYTLSASGYINSYRIYTVAGILYEVFLIKDPLGADIVTRLNTFTETLTGWREFTIDPIIVLAGSVFDLSVVSNEPDPTPTPTIAAYDYFTPQNLGTIGAGEIVQARSLPEFMLISYIDADVTDRTALIQGLSAGDTIESQGFTWTVLGNFDSGSYATVTVSPAVTLTAGNNINFLFNTTTPTSITYALDTDYWLTSPFNVQGLLAIDSDYDSIVPNDTAYGTDITIQNSSVSEDWDVVATSEDVSGAGGDDFILKAGDSGIGPLDMIDRLKTPSIEVDYVPNTSGVLLGSLGIETLGLKVTVGPADLEQGAELNNQRLTGVADPVDLTDGVNLQSLTGYGDGRYLRLSGGTLTGPLSGPVVEVDYIADTSGVRLDGFGVQTFLLDVASNATFGNDITVSNDATVTGKVDAGTVETNYVDGVSGVRLDGLGVSTFLLGVSSNATVGGDVIVTGDVTATNMEASYVAGVSGTRLDGFGVKTFLLNAASNATVGGDVIVTGDVTATNIEASYVADTSGVRLDGLGVQTFLLDVSSNATIGGDLTVTGGVDAGTVDTNYVDGVSGARMDGFGIDTFLLGVSSNATFGATLSFTTDGSATLPTLFWGTDTDTGLYHSENVVYITTAGVDTFLFSPLANVSYKNLDMNSNRINNVLDPNAGHQAFSRDYGDGRYLQQSTADARYLQLTGGTLTGTLNGTVIDVTGDITSGGNVDAINVEASYVDGVSGARMDGLGIDTFLLGVSSNATIGGDLTVSGKIDGGNVELVGQLKITNVAPRVEYYQTDVADRNVWTVLDGTVWQIQQRTDAGAFVKTLFSINSDTGDIINEGDITSGGKVEAATVETNYSAGVSGARMDGFGVNTFLLDVASNAVIDGDLTNAQVNKVNAFIASGVSPSVNNQNGIVNITNVSRTAVGDYTITFDTPITQMRGYANVRGAWVSANVIPLTTTTARVVIWITSTLDASDTDFDVFIYGLI